MKKLIALFLVLVCSVVMTDEYASAARRASHDTPTLRMIEKEGRRRGASRKLIRAVKTIACIESSCGVNPIPAREKSRTPPAPSASDPAPVPGQDGPFFRGVLDPVRPSLRTSP